MDHRPHVVGGHVLASRGVEAVDHLLQHVSGDPNMTAITNTHHTRTRAQKTTYWIATALLVAELTLGGIWDVLRVPLVRNVVTHLGYPTYFLVLLGTWKLLGAAALVVPRLPLVKEWAYAGIFFVFSGAIVSHLTTGKDVQEVAICSVVLVLTVASRALRPAARTLHKREHDQDISVAR